MEVLISNERMSAITIFNCYIRPKETPLDSTQSRDCQSNQWTLPETPVPDTEVLITIRPQIIFLWQNCINKIFNIVTFTASATHIIPKFTNLPVTVNTLHISYAPRLHRDKQLGVSHRRNTLPQFY